MGSRADQYYHWSRVLAADLVGLSEVHGLVSLGFWMEYFGEVWTVVEGLCEEE